MIHQMQVQRRVFIVEDQKLIVADLENTLRKLGYQVTGNAARGDEALNRIGEGRPDLVLMDITLEGQMSGIDAAAAIREKYDIPVVYLTAFGDEETIERAKTTTPYGYIMKPFNERELRAIIEIAIFRHQVDKQLLGELTQKRALEDFIYLFRQAQEAVNAREQFISIAAHELRTPITTFGLLVESLTQDIRKLCPDDKTIEKKLSIMTSSLSHINKLVSNLLDTAHISTGQLLLHMEEFDIAEMVRSTAENFKILAQRAGSTLVVDAQSPQHGSWDRVRLSQVLGNLLSNAIKYGQGKPIEVSLVGIPEEVQLKVSDHGIGMSEKTKELVFKRYERDPAVRKQSGLGLGLYIACEIVKAHGGKFELESSPGKGSTFIIRLPRSIEKPLIAS